MSSPVTPNDALETIPSVNGNFCQKMLSAFKLPKLFYLLVSYMFDNAGKISTDFAADICALGCVGSGTGGGGTGGTGLSAPIISATDGTYADKIVITWDPVLNATSYDIYRSDTNSSAAATPIRTGELNTSFDDTTAVPGEYYYYWVKARNSSQVSGFSNGDKGHAGSIATSLATITDLDASKGFSYGSRGIIRLMWTPVTGAQKYDIYRNTSNDFGTALLVDTNRIPYDNATALDSGDSPYFVNNSQELVYYHDTGDTVLNQFANFYFWVIAKRTDPELISLQSNTALGWGAGPGSGEVPVISGKLDSGQEETVNAGITSVWFALFGMGGGGAGGNKFVGGGAGGGGGTIVGRYAVVAGSKFRIRHATEADTTNAGASTNGGDGYNAILEYSAAGTWADTVTIAIANPGLGGAFNGGGSGAGGAGGASVNTGLTNVYQWTGRAGKPGSGTAGGRAGYRFGDSRGPGAHFNGFAAGNTYQGNGDSRGAGSGSYASPLDAALAVGGKGSRGYVAFGTLE